MSRASGACAQGSWAGRVVSSRASACTQWGWGEGGHTAHGARNFSSSRVVVVGSKALSDALPDGSSARLLVGQTGCFWGAPLHSDYTVLVPAWHSTGRPVVLVSGLHRWLPLEVACWLHLSASSHPTWWWAWGDCIGMPTLHCRPRVRSPCPRRRRSRGPAPPTEWLAARAAGKRLPMGRLAARGAE